MRTLCHDLPASTPGEEVILEGWVHRRRHLSRITFLVLRDRSGLAQVVLPAGTPVPSEETVVRVSGTATTNEQAPGGTEVTDATVVALTEEAVTPPAELWRPGLDVSLPTLLDHAPVLWRHQAQRARWELAAASLRGFRSTLDGYPMAKRPFYTHPWPGDEQCSNSFDVLFRGLELVTGGQRLHRPSDYEHALRTRGEDPAAFDSYLQAFRHGMPPHGGFAIGLERWVARLIEAANVREVTLFPRDLHRLTP